ncbi:methyl-accepting chemotaxis protein [Gilvimarinus xylanilyticus]|uniref:Methyl-accepting chemotaxis protein n=1 Tax=Gilvimarinus xylanilyticus TaxID=2944139 RepID=A0A9X2HYH2_9GAMM|nr:methyl-accepting chemotaxis protein [Gilvimarinus xylanilyticus]
MLRQFSIAQRLLAAAVLVLCVVLGLIGLFSVSYHKSLLEARQVKTQHLIEAAMGVLEHYQRLERSGELTRDQAQSRAIAAIDGLRYGSNDYFWIQNRQVEMVHHPFSQQLNGTSIADLADPNGVRLFSEMERQVTRQGEGFVNYAWPKPGFDEPVPKVSYVKAFAPWGWVLGSGIYIDDVEQVFWQTMRLPLSLAVLGVLVLAAFIYLIARSITLPMRGAVAALEDIASGDGDLTHRLNATGRDELASLGAAFNQFCDKLSGVIANVHRLVEQNRDVVATVKGTMGQANGVYQKQKTELDTVATAIEQMSVTSQEVAQRIGDAAAAAQSSSEQSASGQQTAVQTRQSMDALATDIAGTQAAIARLDEESGRIRTVLDVIRAVAEQTNLLALNAAIEAARAGEQGRGFAVVADEVRTLASRAQDSADEIQTMIDALLESTSAAVQSMQASHDRSEALGERVRSVEQILQEINSAAGTITDMTHHVASAAEEQSQTTHSVAQSLSHLNRYGDEVVNSLDRTEVNTRILADTSAELEAVMKQFRV